MRAPTKRVVGASIIGGALIVAAFIFSTPPTPIANETPALVVATAPNRVAIPEQDQDGDGVPDWKEALNTTKFQQLREQATSTYEVPDTLTGQFSIQLFQDMVNAKGFEMFGNTPEELINKSISDLESEVTYEPLTKKDLSITTETLDATATKNYFNAVAQAIATGQDTGQPKNELAILQKAVTTQDPSQLEAIFLKETAYRAAVTNLQAITVPAEYADIHLDLTNIFAALAISLSAMQDVFNDPIKTLLYVQVHPDNADGLLVALGQYATAVKEVLYVFAPTDPGQIFIRFTPNNE